MEQAPKRANHARSNKAERKHIRPNHPLAVFWNVAIARCQERHKGGYKPNRGVNVYADCEEQIFRTDECNGRPQGRRH